MSSKRILWNVAGLVIGACCALFAGLGNVFWSVFLGICTIPCFLNAAIRQDFEYFKPSFDRLDQGLKEVKKPGA